MKKTKDYTLIVKSDVKKCWEGDRSGKRIEKYYVIIDEKNKIAIDSDCGG